MGIKGLTKLITTECPDALKETTVEQYTGCKIAIDASMTIYQFLVLLNNFNTIHRLLLDLQEEVILIMVRLC